MLQCLESDMGGDACSESNKPAGGKAECPLHAVRNLLRDPSQSREWLALRAFPSLPFAHAILGGKVEVRGSKPKTGDESTNAEEHAPWELPEPLAAAMKRSYNGASFLLCGFFFS